MNLNLTAPINTLGYGYTGLNILKSLQKNNVDVSLFLIGQTQITNPEDAKCINLALQKAEFFDKDATSLKVWHQFDLAQHTGKPTIGFPIFELNKFTDKEKHHLKSVDYLFVCSKWAKNVVKEQTWLSDNVFVVPLGVDITLFQPHPIEKKSGSPTVFLNIGKAEVRKGHDVLCDWFNKAFNKDDNVELWMMFDNPFYTPQEMDEWRQMYLHSPLGQCGKIKLLPRVQSQKDILNVMLNADVGIFPSRAEGWNLELLEMMALGKHVIATDYSGHTEFCTLLQQVSNNGNCYLIKIDKLEDAYDGKWFLNQGQWAHLGDNQQSECIQHMKTLYQLYRYRTIYEAHDYWAINRDGIKTAEKFSWDNSIKKMIGYLNEINNCCSL